MVLSVRVIACHNRHDSKVQTDNLYPACLEEHYNCVQPLVKNGAKVNLLRKRWIQL